MLDIYLSEIFKGVNIVGKSNAVFLCDIKALVVGDMHIGMERKYERLGVHFRHASQSNAKLILDACKSSGAERIVFLGDVKDSIGFPDTYELDALRSFFSILSKYEIIIAKGNHDGHLPEVLDRIGIDAEIKREILLSDFAFMHGNAMPSQDALSKRYVFAGHGHFAIKSGAKLEKVFLVAKKQSAKVGKNRYSSIGRANEKLVMLPAFNTLIYGTQITDMTMNMIPMLRNGVFDFASASVLSADGKRIGNAKTVAKEQERIRLDLA